MTAETPSSYFDTSREAQSRRGKRRQGSRAKLAQRFFEDTYAAWEEQGPSVLARAAFHDPVAFANMVARLMPQKIEVSTPTDGMSDERLAELLDFAERMAGLKAEQAKVLQGEVLDGAAPLLAHDRVDENGLALDGAAAGGGGPLVRMGVGGENTSSTLRADPAEDPHQPFSPLNAASEGTAGPSENVNPLNRIPYPVGKPFATPDHVVEKRNRHNLMPAPPVVEDPIDPASLF